MSAFLRRRMHLFHRAPYALRSMRRDVDAVIPVRAVFLDAGGTLLAERPSRAEIYAAAAGRAGRPIESGAMRGLMRSAHAALPREVGPHFRYSEGWFRAFIARVFGAGLGLGGSAVAEAERELLARFADPATFRLLPGALELVSGLRARGLTVGVVSNWSERLPALLAGLGLSEALDPVVVSAIERCEKPDPEIFRRALARCGVAPGEALHAGDDPDSDVRGARSAGILPVLVGRRRETDVEGAHRVEDLFELERWIEERLA